MARFVGGPCDGQTVPSTIYPQAICGGVTYTQLDDGNYHSGYPAGTGGIAGSSPLNTIQAGRAWHKLMHAIGVNGPRAINKSRASRSRIRRVVR